MRSTPQAEGKLSDYAPLRLALRYLSASKRQLAAVLTWRTVLDLLPMQVPLLTGAIVGTVSGEPLTILGRSLPLELASAVALASLALASLSLLRGWVSYRSRISAARLAQSFVTRLREAVMAKLMALSVETHEEYGSGNLMDRAMTDAGSTRRFVQRVLIRSVTRATRIVYPIAVMFALDASLALVALSVLPPQWLLVRFLQRKLHAAARNSRSSQAELAVAVKSSLDGVETLKAMGGVSASRERVRRRAEEHESLTLYTDRIGAQISGVVWSTTGVGLALAWWQGALRVADGSMTVGSLVAFAGFVVLAYEPLRSFVGIATDYRRGLVSLERLQEILDLPLEIEEAPDARPLRVRQGRIALEGVDLARGGRRILGPLSLSVGPGRLNVIVGPSGAGKSTLLRVLARLLDPDHGQALIDDQDLRMATLATLRAEVKLMPQRTTLFSGTLLDNLRLGSPHATRADVLAACQAAGAVDFIDGLPAGLDTQVGNGVLGLSGGETQRLAIARAILNQPRVLLMDEPTSALGPQAEAEILERLRKLADSRTVVITTHRPAVLGPEDLLLVLDKGRLVAEGTRASLLAESEPGAQTFPFDGRSGVGRGELRR